MAEAEGAEIPEHAREEEVHEATHAIEEDASEGIPDGVVEENTAIPANGTEDSSLPAAAEEAQSGGPEHTDIGTAEVEASTAPEATVQAIETTVEADTDVEGTAALEAPADIPTSTEPVVNGESTPTPAESTEVTTTLPETAATLDPPQSSEISPALPNEAAAEPTAEPTSEPAPHPLTGAESSAAELAAALAVSAHNTASAYSSRPVKTRRWSESSTGSNEDGAHSHEKTAAGLAGTGAGSKTEAPSTNRLSILYEDSSRRLCFDANVVERVRIFRAEGKIEVGLKFEPEHEEPVEVREVAKVDVSAEETIKDEAGEGDLVTKKTPALPKGILVSCTC